MSHSGLTRPYGVVIRVEYGRIGRGPNGESKPSAGDAGTFRPRKCADRPKDVRGEADHGRSDHHVGPQRHFRRQRRGLVQAAQAAGGAPGRRAGDNGGQSAGRPAYREKAGYRRRNDFLAGRGRPSDCDRASAGSGTNTRGVGSSAPGDPAGSRTLVSLASRSRSVGSSVPGDPAGSRTFASPAPRSRVAASRALRSRGFGHRDPDSPIFRP